MAEEKVKGAVKDLTEGEPAKLIFYFTLPLLAGNVFQQLFGFVDTLIVGRFLGVEALASVGCTGSLMFLMLGFVMGMTSGFSIFTGQRFGAKDYAGIRYSVVVCMTLSIIATIILSAIGVIYCRELLILMQTPPEILDGAYDFIVIIYGGVGGFVIIQMQSNLIRALGDSKMPTVIQATTLCINIALEPVAIIVLGLGIPGAAGATILSLILGNIVCAVYIKKKVPLLHVTKEDFYFDKAVIYEHLKIGLPMGFQASIIAIGAVVLQMALNGLGPVAVASFAAAQRVDAIATMPMMSFGIAIAAYTAQNFGAKKFSRISDGVKKTIWMSCSFSVAIAIINIMFGTKLIEIFVGEGQDQIIEYGQIFLVTNGGIAFYFPLCTSRTWKKFCPDSRRCNGTYNAYCRCNFPCGLVGLFRCLSCKSNGLARFSYSAVNSIFHYPPQYAKIFGTRGRTYLIKNFVKVF